MSTTETLQNLKIHKMSNETYDTKVKDGSIENTALYLTPDDVSAGDEKTPVYFDNGVPVACTSIDLPTANFSRILRNGNVFNNVLEVGITTNDPVPTAIVIKTKIPFKHIAAMPVVHLKGFAYGDVAPIDLTIAFYVFDEAAAGIGENLLAFTHYVATNTGMWKPKIMLSTYKEGDTDYVAISLFETIYYPKFVVNVYNCIGNNLSTNIMTDWTYDYYGHTHSLEDYYGLNNPNNKKYNLGQFDLDAYPVKLENGTLQWPKNFPVPTENFVKVPYGKLATDILGNAATATKVNNALKIKLTDNASTEGTDLFTYDGSGEQIVTIKTTDADIKLSEDIWTDKTIGYIEGTPTSPKKVAKSGETLKTMFTNIFGTVTDDTSNLVTNPSISSVSIGSASYEYGTKLSSLPVTITTSSGSYKYGPAVSGAGWKGNYTLSGTGFTTKSDSTSTSQTVSLSSTFTVGTSSLLTLNVSMSYDDATNTAQSKMGNTTTQKITAGTASRSGTFNPTAIKYVYYAVTSNTTTPTSWKKYSTGTTSTTDLSIPADAGKYVWIATTSNCSNIYAFNEVSSTYNTDAIATTKLSSQTIKNSQNADVSGYYIYRTTNAKALGGTVKYKLG